MSEQQTSIRPANIAVDKQEKTVRVTWTDGRESTYSFEQLRAACPCAECRTQRADENLLRQALVVSTGLQDAQLVGNYAIQLIWDDGHRYGIFTWDFLRSLG